MIKKLRNHAAAFGLRSHPLPARVAHSGIATLGKRTLFGIGFIGFLAPLGVRENGPRAMNAPTPAPVQIPRLASASMFPTLAARPLFANDLSAQFAPFTTVHIVGPWVVPANTWCTWTPDIPGVSGPPYAGTIHWSVNGQFASPVWSFSMATPSANFTLLLEVWGPDGTFIDSEQRIVQVSSSGSC